MAKPDPKQALVMEPLRRKTRNELEQSAAEAVLFLLDVLPDVYYSMGLEYRSKLANAYEAYKECRPFVERERN